MRIHSPAVVHCLVADFSEVSASTRFLQYNVHRLAKHMLNIKILEDKNSYQCKLSSMVRVERT